MCKNIINYIIKIMQSGKKGFTLIELLVVISVISLLSSIVFASLNNARAKARNAKRIQDINQLVNAFNLGYTNGFPINGGDWACVSATCYGAWNGFGVNGTVDAGFTPFISKPVDPAGRRDTSGGGIDTGGFVYLNPTLPAPSPPYNVPAWTSAAYIGWIMEGTVSSTICGRGRIYATGTGGGGWVSCRLKLE